MLKILRSNKKLVLYICIFSMFIKLLCVIAVSFWWPNREPILQKRLPYQHLVFSARSGNDLFVVDLLQLRLYQHSPSFELYYLIFEGKAFVKVMDNSCHEDLAAGKELSQFLKSMIIDQSFNFQKSRSGCDLFQGPNSSICINHQGFIEEFVYDNIDVKFQKQVVISEDDLRFSFDHFCTLAL
ncbi:hypothetical protein GEMRC1_011490 [Eukaryota sp. GEM-RC1]